MQATLNIIKLTCISEMLEYLKTTEYVKNSIDNYFKGLHKSSDTSVKLLNGNSLRQILSCFIFFL